MTVARLSRWLAVSMRRLEGQSRAIIVGARLLGFCLGGFSLFALFSFHTQPLVEFPSSSWKKLNANVRGRKRQLGVDRGAVRKT